MRFRSVRRLGATVVLAASTFVVAAQPAAAYPPYLWMLQTGPGPSPRAQSAMAYLPGTGLVMYGGCFISPCPTDTWKWTGTGWTQIATGPGPNLCWGGKMVYDFANTQLVLVCSAFAPQPTGTTVAIWTFDGTTWTDRTFATAVRPPERQEFTLTYDVYAARVVLFGGFANSGQIRNDTWEWNGATQTWTQTVAQGAPGAPSVRYGAGAAYHVPTGQSVVFGGSPHGGTQPTDTWGYDATTDTWTQLATTGPLDRWRPGMAFDSLHGELVLFGGYSLTANTHLNDTWAWAWNGVSWAWTPHPAAGGPFRYGFAMAYHPPTHKTVLFGGQPLPGGATDETYTYG